MNVNSERTRKVMISLGQTSDGEAIKLLEQNPKLQLEFLKEVLAQRDEGKKIPSDLLILHIKLLCQLAPKQIAQEVKRYPYPVDECLKICRQYDAKEGLAFFLDASGNIMEALAIYVEVYQTTNCIELTLEISLC